MRLRPYRYSDFEHSVRWIDNERAHVLWCGGRLPYPLTEDAFHACLAAALEKGECGFVLSEDSGIPVGFCVLSVNDEDNTGFLRFIIVDGSRRGQGLGGQMLARVLKYAGELAGVDVVRLIVFDANPAAARCYEKAGFVKECVLPETKDYGSEVWQRIMMAAKL